MLQASHVSCNGAISNFFMKEMNLEIMGNSLLLKGSSGNPTVPISLSWNKKGGFRCTLRLPKQSLTLPFLKRKKLHKLVKRNLTMELQMLKWLRKVQNAQVALVFLLWKAGAMKFTNLMSCLPIKCLNVIGTWLGKDLLGARSAGCAPVGPLRLKPQEASGFQVWLGLLDLPQMVSAGSKTYLGDQISS